MRGWILFHCYLTGSDCISSCLHPLKDLGQGKRGKYSIIQNVLHFPRPIINQTPPWEAIQLGMCIKSLIDAMLQYPKWPPIFTLISPNTSRQTISHANCAVGPSVALLFYGICMKTCINSTYGHKACFYLLILRCDQSLLVQINTAYGHRFVPNKTNTEWRNLVIIALHLLRILNWEREVHCREGFLDLFKWKHGIRALSSMLPISWGKIWKGI